jgi:transglutaminase-like putative cysteine protease
MWLTVDHVTRYTYDRPVRGVVQSHRLTPSVFDGQRTIDWQVTVSGGMAGGMFRDGAGDLVQGWTVPGPVTEIEVRVLGTIDTVDLTGVLRGHRESVTPEAYLRSTEPTTADAAIVRLAAQANDVDDLARAHTLSAAVADAIAYRPGVTNAHTTAAEALAQGEGVCQDHAHTLIAMARSLGMPSRYVSGYLHSSADGAAHEAAHAWAEVWMPALGWVGFDPANRCCPDDRYIRLGSGMDAQDAAPIRGISRGGGQEIMSVTVAIQAAQQ